MKKEITAVKDGLKILDEAKKLGTNLAMQHRTPVSTKMQDLIKRVKDEEKGIKQKNLAKDEKEAMNKIMFTEKEIGDQLNKAFKDFNKKHEGKPGFQPQAALRYFLDGYQEAMED